MTISSPNTVRAALLQHVAERLRVRAENALERMPAGDNLSNREIVIAAAFSAVSMALDAVADELDSVAAEELEK